MADHLFVYGTLRRAVAHPMHRELVRYADYVGTARFSGRMFDLGAYPAVVAEPRGRSWVVGELYRLRQPAKLIPLLDRYEGCTDSKEGDAEYRRERQAVSAPDGRSVDAWIYLYNRPTAALPVIASGDYLRR